MKSELKAMLGHATGVKANIYGDKENEREPDKAWHWAANSENGGKLRVEMKKLESRMSGFHNRWMNEEIMDVKKTTSAEVQLYELRTFVGTDMKSQVELVSQALATIVSRHNAMPVKKTGKKSK